MHWQCAVRTITVARWRTVSSPEISCLLRYVPRTRIDLGSCAYNRWLKFCGPRYEMVGYHSPHAWRRRPPQPMEKLSAFCGSCESAPQIGAALYRTIQRNGHVD